MFNLDSTLLSSPWVIVSVTVIGWIITVITAIIGWRINNIQIKKMRRDSLSMLKNQLIIDRLNELTRGINKIYSEKIMIDVCTDVIYECMNGYIHNSTGKDRSQVLLEVSKRLNNITTILNELDHLIESSKIFLDKAINSEKFYAYKEELKKLLKYVLFIEDEFLYNVIKNNVITVEKINETNKVMNEFEDSLKKIIEMYCTFEDSINYEISRLGK